MKNPLNFFIEPSSKEIRAIIPDAKGLREFHDVIPALGGSIHKKKTYPYKGTYRTYPKWINTAYYPSYYEISDDKLSISGVVGNKSFNLRSCKGYYFDTDNNGLKLVSRANQKDDLHLDSGLVFEKITVLRGILLRNREMRIELKHKAARHKRFNNIFHSNIGNTMVLVEDARRAGNCSEGIRAFAIRNKLIVNYGVPANLLSELAKKETSISDRIKLSIRAAFERETMICI